MELHGNFYYIVSHQRKRPWGDTLQLAVFDASTPEKSEFGFRHIQTVELPQAVDIESYLDRLAVKLEAPEPEPEKMMAESEVVAMLVEKQLLAPGAKLTDLKSKAELTKAVVK